MSFKRGYKIYREIRDLQKKLINCATVATEDSRSILIEKMIDDEVLPPISEELDNSQKGWAKLTLKVGMAKARQRNLNILVHQNQDKFQEIIHRNREEILDERKAKDL